MTPEAMAELHASAFERGWSGAEIAQMIAREDTFCVAEPSGFAIVRVVLDEAELLTIVVAQSARKSGQGAALTKALLAQAKARGARHVFLEVAQDNKAARALYAKTGFSEIGRRKGYYPRPDGAVDAVLMAAQLA